MGKVFVRKTMSLDGFIADKDDGVGRLMGWYRQGDIEYALPDGMLFKLSAASLAWFREMIETTGAIVGGRRDYDVSQYGEEHPMGIPHFVVTHHPPEKKPNEWFEFVTDGVENAIKQATVAAGEKNVVVTGAKIVQQALKAGLLDEVRIDLAPVLIGGGVRLFEHFGDGPVELEPVAVIEGQGVTHLRYGVVG